MGWGEEKREEKRERGKEKGARPKAAIRNRRFLVHVRGFISRNGENVTPTFSFALHKILMP